MKWDLGGIKTGNIVYVAVAIILVLLAVCAIAACVAARRADDQQAMILRRNNNGTSQKQSNIDTADKATPDSERDEAGNDLGAIGTKTGR